MEAWAELLAAIALIVSALSTAMWILAIKRRSCLGAASRGGERAVKRYLVFRIYRIEGEGPGFKELEDGLRAVLREHLGELGMSRTSFKLVRYDPGTGFGVARLVTPYLREAVFAISRLRSCGGSTFIISTLALTGTLRGAVERIRGFERRYRRS